MPFEALFLVGTLFTPVVVYIYCRCYLW